MGRCRICNKEIGLFSYLCDNCEEIRRTVYAKKHTFCYGDKVKVIIDGIFFGEGVVVGAKYEPAYDYCAATHSYDVKFSGGEIHRYLGAELEKGDGGV